MRRRPSLPMRWMLHCRRLLNAKACDEGTHSSRIELRPLFVRPPPFCASSSIGAGSGGDIQFLFAEDILGNHAPPFPRHTKQYRNLFKMEQAMQVERVEGFRDYINDVKSSGFPGPEHVVKAPQGLIEQFLTRLDGPLSATQDDLRSS